MHYSETQVSLGSKTSELTVGSIRVSSIRFGRGGSFRRPRGQRSLHNLSLLLGVVLNCHKLVVLAVALGAAATPGGACIAADVDRVDDLWYAMFVGRGCLSLVAILHVFRWIGSVAPLERAHITVVVVVRSRMGVARGCRDGGGTMGAWLVFVVGAHAFSSDGGGRRAHSSGIAR